MQTSLTLLALASLVLAALAAPASIRANNDACLQQAAKDAHTRIDDLVQSRADQEALVLAVTECSR